MIVKPNLRRTKNPVSGEAKRRKLKRLQEFSGGDLCFYCDRELVVAETHPNKADRRTYDHVVALNQGGSNHVWNLVLSCRGCNGRKKEMPVENFLRLVLNLDEKVLKAKLTKLQERELRLRRQAKRNHRDVIGKPRR